MKDSNGSEIVSPLDQLIADKQERFFNEVTTTRLSKPHCADPKKYIRARDIPTDLLFSFLAAVGVPYEEARDIQHINIDLDWRLGNFVKLTIDRFSRSQPPQTQP